MKITKVVLVKALAQFLFDERKEIMDLAEELHQALFSQPVPAGEPGGVKPKVKKRRKRRALGPAATGSPDEPNLNETFPPEE